MVAPMPETPPPAGPAHSMLDAVGDHLAVLVSTIPASREVARANPAPRARELIAAAAWKAGATSGALSLPPGPLGMATILPDLYAIWKIQAQLVADLAAIHGKQPQLTRDMLLYCLFRHAASQLARDLVVRVGERVLIKEIPQKLLRRLGITVSERVMGRAFSRFLPIVGAVGTGAYAYYDTRQVARTALELFSQPLLSSASEEDEAISSPS